MVAYAYTLSAQETEAGGLLLSCLHSEFQVSQSYIKDCFIKQNKGKGKNEEGRRKEGRSTLRIENRRIEEI